MMNMSKEDFPYREEKGVQLIQLDYKDGFCATVILPSLLDGCAW